MPKRILLADDSITIQKVVELTFSDGDYEIVSANNGARALQKLAESMPDIILSDIIMPEKNGYEVCEFVKSHPEYRDIPVILLTGTFEPFDPDRAQKAGCDAVVTKPFESQSLINKVEELIQKRRQMDDHSRALRGEAFVKQPLDSFLTPPPPAPAADESAAVPEADHSKTMPWQMPTVDQSAEQQTGSESQSPFAADEAPLEAAFEAPVAGDEESPFGGASGWQLADEAPQESSVPAAPFEEPLADSGSEQQMNITPEDAVFDAPGAEPAPEDWSEQELERQDAVEDESRQAGEGAPFVSDESSFESEAETPAEPQPENLPEASWAAPVDHAWATPAVDEGAHEAGEPARTLPFPQQEEAAPEHRDQQDDSYSAPTIISPSGVADGFAAWAPQPSESWTNQAGPEIPQQEIADVSDASPELDEGPAAEFAPEASAGGEETTAPEYDPSAIRESAPQEQAEGFEASEPELSVPAAEPGAAQEGEPGPQAARSLTDEDVERIARRVVELMTGDVVKNIAWEVVPDVAEMVVRERVRQLEKE